MNIRKRPAGMSRVGVILVALVATASTLVGCASGSGATTRTIQVDYRHDEFTGSFLGYYPHTVTVKPGTTLKFHQTWTGEPHTVTFGTRVTELVAPILDIVHDSAAGRPIPNEEPPGARAFDEGLPSFFGAEEGVNQTAGQPCYLRSGATIPSDLKPCPKVAQPAFDGTEPYYSSGVIPFEGVGGNTYEMKIAPQAKPGTYFYYCNLHGPLMFGEVTVAPNKATESQAALNRRGKAEADKLAKPLLAEYKAELAGKAKFKGNLAGSGDEATNNLEGIVNEFTPRTIETAAGKPVTWTFVGGHSVSFNVPPYAPLFTIEKDGTVLFQEKLRNAAGGWPDRVPKVDSHGDGPPPDPVHADAGKWDGSAGLHSSGVDWVSGDTYTVTFTKKGTYPYACLIHPGMIGKVVVK